MIKVIIFDFDNTLYNGDVWQNWDGYINTFLDEYFKKEKEKQIFLNKHLADANFLDERYICNGLIREVGTAEPMINYLINNPYEYTGKNVMFVKNDFLKELSKDFHLYIVSNTPSNTIKIALKKYGIDSNLFKDILFNPAEKLDSTKKDKYQKIMNAENVKTNEVIVVGDSFNSDIKPALELDMQHLLVGSLDDIYNFDFKNDIT